MLRSILPNRTYKSGTGIQWCLFRWSDAQEPYLTRLFLFKTPRFAACLNWIKEPDSGDPHDHTSYFFSVILGGWYRERRLLDGRDEVLTRRWFNYMRGSDKDAHRILEVAPGGGALTLCLMGPKIREWYYHTPTGLVHWSEYKLEK
jgi:hypothetical protein